MKLPPPPKAKVRVRRFARHGVTVRDPYAWLYDKNFPLVKDKAIIAYLKAENAYADAWLEPHRRLIAKLFSELKGRIPGRDQGVPVRHGPYLYRWRFSQGRQYRTWVRKKRRGGNWRVILDENTRARGKKFYHLGGLAVSPDHRLLAFSEEDQGGERFTMRVKKLTTGEMLPERIPWTIGEAVWAADGKSFFYTVLNKEWRPHQVRRHVLGRSVTDDRVIYEEKDPGFFVGVSHTTSRKFVVISTGDHVTSEVRVIPARRPDRTPALIARRRRGRQYEVDHGAGKFFIRVNDRHRNFRIVTAPEDDPRPKRWRGLIAGNDRVYIRGHQVFRDFLVVQERRSGLDRIRVRRHRGGTHWIRFPEKVCAAHLGHTEEYAAGRVRVVYESMITPVTVYDYHVASRRLIRRKVRKIPSGYDKRNYKTVRLMAPARGGVRVPVSLVYRKGLRRDGTAPLHLYGYGAYGSGMPPWFNPNILSLLDRGFVYAIAHVRGGDEMGYQWYRDGKLEKRTNAFHDFIAAAEHLIEKGYAGKGNISIEGRSAGGELVGYVLNKRPELWKAAIAGVPFVDVLNTMLNEKLPLTPIEWQEWGNPVKNKRAFLNILSYSPYDNITPQPYPAVFASAGLNDPRVTYWEPAKWVARLRANTTSKNPILLRTNMKAGHGGRSGRFERLRERAEEFAFLLVQFGLAGK